MRQGDRRRPGNVVLRRTRVHPEVLQVPRRRRLRFTPKLWMIPGAFALVIGLGTLLLSLPAASESRTWTDGWDALFTATSAVSVTGLVRFDTAEHWSGFGEIVILGLFQAGGLGVTMYAGAILLIVGQRFGLRGREFFGMEMMAVGEHDVRRLLRRGHAVHGHHRIGGVSLAVALVPRPSGRGPGRVEKPLSRRLRLQQRRLRSYGWAHEFHGPG